MEVNVIRAKYIGGDIVKELNNLINTNEELDINLVENPLTYDKYGVNVLVYDYTPIATGNILIKHTNEKWKKLRLNSKIANRIKASVSFYEPHAYSRNNWLASIQRSCPDTISI